MLYVFLLFFYRPKRFFFLLVSFRVTFLWEEYFFLSDATGNSKGKQKKKCKVVNKFTIREEETVEYCVVLYGKERNKNIQRRKKKVEKEAEAAHLCPSFTTLHACQCQPRARIRGLFSKQTFSTVPATYTTHILFPPP